MSDLDEKLKIRLSEESDASLLISFLMEPGVLEFFPMSNLKEVEDAAKISISYREVGSAYTAVYDGVICGNTVLYLSPFTKNRHQSLFMIIVSERFRNRGVGSKMLEHLCDVAKKDHHLDLLHLEVYESNKARGLYERHGFVQYGEHPHFLRDGDQFYSKILMQKKL